MKLKILQQMKKNKRLKKVDLVLKKCYPNNEEPFKGGLFANEEI